MKLEFSGQIFKKYSCIKFHKNQAELYHADRRMDRQDEANSRFSEFCKRAQKPQFKTL